MFAYRPVDATGPAPFKTPRHKTQRNENDYGSTTTQFPKTPLPGKPLQHIVTIGKGVQETSLRPRQALGDKTPAANLRQITLNIGGKGKQSDVKPLAFVDDALPQSVTRPSATRKSVKTPRFSVEKRNLLKTPEPSGKAHWDVSDIDMSMEQTQESIVEECFDEPDYMPPTAIIPPIAPEYGFPNWKELGSTVMSLARTRLPGEEIITSHECDVVEISEEHLQLDVRPETPPPIRGLSKVTKESSIPAPTLPPCQTIRPLRSTTALGTRPPTVLRPPPRSLTSMAAPTLSNASRIGSLPRPTTRSASMSKPAVKAVSRDPHRAASKPTLRSTRVRAVPVAAAFNTSVKAEPKVAVVERSELLMEELPTFLQTDLLDDGFLFDIPDN